MVTKPWNVLLAKQAQKDAKKIAKSPLKEQAKKILAILESNPLQTPPSYEKLIGDLSGFYSRRLNIQHRIVYEVFTKEHTVVIASMWSHYE